MSDVLVVFTTRPESMLASSHGSSAWPPPGSVCIPAHALLLYTSSGLLEQQLQAPDRLQTVQGPDGQQKVLVVRVKSEAALSAAEPLMRAMYHLELTPDVKFKPELLLQVSIVRCLHGSVPISSLVRVMAATLHTAPQHAPHCTSLPRGHSLDLQCTRRV
jgi:hypothetical protein